MNTKKLLIFGLLCLFIPDLLSQNKSEIQTAFQVNRKDLTTVITSDGLNISVSILKPGTIPQSSEPGTWKKINEVTRFKKLGGISGTVHSITYTTNIGQLDCETWISEMNDLVGFRQVFTNKSKKPVKLNNLFPLFINGREQFNFGTISNWRILEQFRHKNDLPKVETPSPGKTINCDPFFIINNNDGHGGNLMIGYQTFYLHLADISVSFDAGLQLNNITANCNFEGVVVPQDGSRTSQWVILSQGADANSLMSDYTSRIRTFYDIEEPPKNAPSVYCTWYYHAENYNENLFVRDITQFKKENLPFDAFLIDECWDVSAWGDFESNNKFPHGMKWVAEQISSAGYMPGIWTAPFLTDEGSNLIKNHPEWLLKNSKGKLCTFFMNNEDHNILDLTYPGVCDYLEEQFRKISQDWGFRYYKFDFMRSVFLDTDQQFYDKSATSLEAYRRGLEAIRRGTGYDAYISVCGGHYGASLGIANTQRSGSDVKSQWDGTELPKYRQNILRTWMAGLWHVDPDAMMVRRQDKPEPDDKRNLTTGKFTDEEAFTNAINQFIGGNLITFTEDFTKLDEDRKMLYKNVIPSVNSSSIPLDLFNPVCPEIMLTAITPKCKNLCNWNMLSIVNWSDKSKDYEILFDNQVTGNLKGDQFLVYDFQTRKLITQLARGNTLSLKGVNGHNSKLLKIVPWDGKSVMFIGTDLNFSCGGLEIKDIDYDNGTIRGLLETNWNVPVKLTFVVPSADGYELKEIETVSGQRRFFLDY